MSKSSTIIYTSDVVNAYNPDYDFDGWGPSQVPLYGATGLTAKDVSFVEA